MEKKQVKVIYSLGTLLHLAKKMAQMRKTGTEKEYLEAKLEHDNYQKMCLESDELVW